MASSNRLSYPIRLFVWLLGYSLLLTGCFVAFQYQREKEFKAEKLNSQLQLINTYIITELDEGHEVSEINLREFHPFEDIRVSVIAENGSIIYDNTLDSLPDKSHIGRTEIKDAMKTGAGYTVRRHSESTGETYFYAARQSDQGYVVRTAVKYSISLSELLKADYGFIWIMGLISLMMCVLGYFATQRVGQHITRLRRFSADVEKGVKISEIEPFPHDELGEISNHIVRLYARLQQAIIDRDSEHRAALHEQREKERIKKQLTNNINHELKTPVASIRVCVETLLAHKEIDPAKHEMFLQRCLANADRLQRLLGDVALITRIDDGSTSILREPVDLSAIIGEVVCEQQLIAQSKGITIRNDISRPLPLTGNRSLLEAIFTNLIDNAIAYSGGTEISLSLNVSDRSDSVTLSVADNGNGVAEEHLPRLFERFYRIDKGRSRAAGGTGLGLAIVKNAVLIHGGTVSVENRPTGGLLFRITLLTAEIRS